MILNCNVIFLRNTKIKPSILAVEVSQDSTITMRSGPENIHRKEALRIVAPAKGKPNMIDEADPSKNTVRRKK